MEIATRTRRIAAFLIDYTLFCFALPVVIFAVNGPVFDGEGEVFPRTLWTVAAMIVFFAVLFCKDFIGGSSPGRWITGILVRDNRDREAAPPKMMLALRNFFLIIWPIEVFVMIFRRDKRRWGDLCTQTIVIENPRKATRAKRITTLVCSSALIFVSGIFCGNCMLRNSAAGQAAFGYVATDPDIQGLTGGVTGYSTLTTGSIGVVDGHGTAVLNFRVKGKSQDVKVTVSLEKQPDGPWQVTQLQTR